MNAQYSLDQLEKSTPDKDDEKIERQKKELTKKAMTIIKNVENERKLILEYENSLQISSQ